MRQLFCIAVAFTCLCCKEPKLRNRVGDHMQGLWKIEKAELDAWGSGPGGKTIHEYSGKVIEFDGNGKFVLLSQSDTMYAGYYKVHPLTAGDFNVHMDFQATKDRPTKKEYWEFFNGRGRSIRAGIEMLEGSLQVKLEKI